MSILQAATEYKAKVQGMLGDQFGVISRDMDHARASGTLDHPLQVGQAAPEFTLPDAFGKQVSLKTLLASGPVIVSFYRGEWCPFCNIELHGFEQSLPKIKQLGASLIAISPEKPDYGIIATEKHKLTYPVLSDFGNTVARQFGIVFEVGSELQDFSKNVFKNDLALRNADGSYELPVPATFVIDTTGIIRFAHVNVDYMVGRAEPEAVVAELAQIAQPVTR